MIDYEALFRAERAKVEELEETIRQLLGGETPPQIIAPCPVWPVHMSPAEQAICSVLLATNEYRIATHERLHDALVANEFAYGGPVDAFEQGNKVKVYVHRVRRKLEPFSIDIINVWGKGYFIPQTSIDAWYSAIDDIKLRLVQ